MNEEFELILKKNNWFSHLETVLSGKYLDKINELLTDALERHTVYPEISNIFRVFKEVDYNDVKVVIIGEDPYVNPEQAIGRAFAVSNGMTIPPSLKNIFKEIEMDCQISIPKNKSDLSGWQSQGVFLLNSILTVQKGASGSHSHFGWEIITDQAIRALSDRKDSVIFLLWGKIAQEKIELIDRKKHGILIAPHPSPQSAHTGFFGCKHFSKTNELLIKLGHKPIDWSDI